MLRKEKTVQVQRLLNMLLLLNTNLVYKSTLGIVNKAVNKFSVNPLCTHNTILHTDEDVNQKLENTGFLALMSKLNKPNTVIINEGRIGKNELVRSFKKRGKSSRMENKHKTRKKDTISLQ